MRFNFVAPVFTGPTEGFREFSKKDLIGGAEVYLYDLSQLLIRKGHQVVVLQPGDKGSLDFDGIQVQGVPLPKVLKSQVEFSFFWRKHIEPEADRVHLHSFELAYPFGDHRMTATCHGINWDCPPHPLYQSTSVYERMVPGFKRRYLKRRARYSVKHLRAIVSVDSFLLRYVQSEMPLYRERINVVPNYVDLDRFAPGNTPNPTDKIRILFPRNLSFNRGVHTILGALAHLVKTRSDLLLQIVGNGPQREWAMRYVQEHNLGQFVEFLGHVDHYREMPGVIRDADIVVIPSFCSEGTSLSCLEAMAMGKAVIVSNIGGLIDIVRHEENGLVVPPSEVALASAISRLADEPGLRRTLGDHARRHVERHHSKEKWEAAYCAFFEA